MASTFILLIMSFVMYDALKDQHFFQNSSHKASGKERSFPNHLEQKEINVNANDHHWMLKKSRIKINLQNRGDFKVYQEKITYGEGKTDDRFDRDSSLATVSKHHMVRRTSESPCIRVGTCKYNANFTMKMCYCDNECAYYKDCCLDATHNKTSKAEPEKFEYMSCEKFNIPEKYASGVNIGFYFVTKCPNDEEKCDHYGTSVPVTDHNGISYRNEHCAQCHGIQHYRFWSVAIFFDQCKLFDYTSIRTTVISDRIEIMRQHKCKMYFIPPTDIHENRIIMPRTCFTIEKRYYKDENSTLCENFANPVNLIHGNIVIKNHFCLKETFQYYVCARSSNAYTGLYDIDSYSHRLLPMFVMFQFHENPDNRNHNCAAELANVNQAFEECSDGKCSSSAPHPVCSEEAVRNYFLKYNIIFQIHNVNSLPTIERALILYYLSLPVNFYSMESNAMMGKLICSEDIRMNQPKDCCIANVTINATVRRKMTHQETFLFRSSAIGMQFLYTERDYYRDIYTTVENSTPNNHSCELGDSKKFVRIFLYPNAPEKLLNRISFDIKPVMDFMQVPRLSNITVTKKQKQDYDMTYPLDAKSMLNTTVTDWVMIFPDKPNASTKENVLSLKPSYIQTIITYATMGISSASLLITMGLFVYFEMYKLLSDRVCMTMMTILFLANVLFMSGSGATVHDSLCTFIGILLHYLWLCVFSWLTLYTVLLKTILTRLRKDLSYDPEVIFSRIGIVIRGFGIPLLFVVPSIICSRFQFESFEIRYSFGMCFITGFPVNIIFFSGPLILSIMINFFLLCRAFKEFTSYTFSSLSTTNQNAVMYMVAFIKLCLISGIFWIFGILAQALNNDVLRYVFVVICGSQGLITSLCFLTSTRIRQNIRNGKTKTDLNRTTTPKQIDDIELRENI